MEVYTLKSPISAIGGDTISELHFDWEHLGLSDYRQILRIEAKLRGTDTAARPSFDISIGKKTSSEFRIGAAWVAAVKGTQGLCMDDMDRLVMLDLLELETRGLLFFGELA